MNDTATPGACPVKYRFRRLHRMPARIATALACVAAIASASLSSGAAGPSPLDFSEYQRLLDDHLVITSPRGAPLETRFDYFKLYASAGCAERMVSVRTALLSVAPAELSREQRRAWAINTYNFLVLDLATANLISRHIGLDLKAQGIFGIPVRSVQHIKINGAGFFEFPVAQIGGHDYNLDQFERKFVFDDPEPAASGTKRKPLAKSLDPRAHFALVCGAIGCPPLQPRAFVPESLDVQLDRATRNALAHTKHLSWDPELKRLAASSVFTWYEADFGGAAKAFEFALRYAPDSLRAVAAAKPQPGFDRTLPWNWDLNTVPQKPRPARPVPDTP